MFEKGKKKGTLRFALKPKKGTKTVAVAGDFNGWKPQAMRKGKTGEFVAVVDANSGAHEYKFIVDGDWLTDPDNSSWSMNPYGTMNSVARVE